VGTKEVVVGHEQSGKGYRAINTVKTGGGPHMVFESSVQPLNKLLQSPPLFRLGIQVLQADNLLMLNFRAFILSIQEMDAGRIGWIAVGNENDFLVGRCSPDRFLHGNNGGLSTPVACYVIGGNLEALGRDEEEDVVVLAQDLDVGFIAR